MDFLLLAALLVLCTAVFLFFTFRSKYANLPGPGVREYFPNGKVFTMLTDTRQMLRTLITMWKTYGDVYQVYFGPSDTVTTTVPADIVQVLSGNSFIRPAGMQLLFRELFPGSLFTLPPELHFAARRNLRENFNYAILEGMHTHIAQATNELCESLLEEAQKSKDGQRTHITNITQQLSVTTFRVITNAAFGCNLGKEDRKQFGEITDQLVQEMLKDLAGYPIRHMLAPFGLRNQLLSSSKEMNAFCARFIKQRQEESQEDKEARPKDILDMILSISADDHKSILSQTIVFAVAGSHTTNEVLAWTIYELCQNPEVIRKIQNELDDVLGERAMDEPVKFEDVAKLTYLQNVWKEALRLRPPGGFILREATKDIKLNGSGVGVRKGDLVLCLFMAAHVNPSIWNEPQKFVPERWDSKTGEGNRAPPGSYVPFSVGPRNCAGRFLADYESVVILAELYRRFEFTLACSPSEVVSCTGWIESAKTCVDGSDYGFGVPVYVKTRG